MPGMEKRWEEPEGLLRRRDGLKGCTMSGKYSTAVWVQDAAWMSTEAWSVSVGGRVRKPFNSGGSREGSQRDSGWIDAFAPVFRPGTNSHWVLSDEGHRGL